MPTNAKGNPHDQTSDEPVAGQPLPPPAPGGHYHYTYPYPAYPTYPTYPVHPGYPAPPRPTNGLAVASLVLGIVWIYWIGSILALIFGYVARSQIKQRGESGAGMAIAGIVLGWIGLAILLTVIITVIIAESGTSGF